MRTPRKPPNREAVLTKHKDEDIVKYLEREDIAEFLNEMYQRYLPWDKFRYQPAPEGTSKEFLWVLEHFIRTSRIKVLTLYDDPSFKFRYNITDTISEKLHNFDMNLGGSIGGKSVVPEEDRDHLLISSIMEEAIASSQLEGASTTREVAKDMLRKSRRPRTKSELMIVNNYRTIRRIRELKGRPLSPSLIQEIHASITSGTLGNEELEGVFRTSNDIVIEDTETCEPVYYPPDFTLLPELIDNYCNFANSTDDTIFIHPIIRATMLHFLMGYIHPFVDGNGRTARALFYWSLLNKGYWLCEYMSISRIIKRGPAKYACAYLYTEGDDNDLTYFINFQLRTLTMALKELRDHIHKKIKERDELFNLEKIQEINDRQASILLKYSLDTRTSFTIKEIAVMYNVGYQTARNDLLGLLDLGFVEKRYQGKKKLIFIRGNDFDIKLREFKEIHD